MGLKFFKFLKWISLVMAMDSFISLGFSNFYPHVPHFRFARDNILIGVVFIAIYQCCLANIELNRLKSDVPPFAPEMENRLSFYLNFAVILIAAFNIGGLIYRWNETDSNFIPADVARKNDEFVESIKTFADCRQLPAICGKMYPESARVYKQLKDIILEKETPLTWP